MPGEGLRLGGVELPGVVVRGRSDGPHLVLAGGLAGCDYSAVAAVVRAVRELDPDELAGTVTAAPVVAFEAYRERRPDRADGARLAELLEPADVALALGSGGVFEALAPFAACPPGDDPAAALATALGLPLLVADDGLALPAPVPAAVARAGGGALLEEAAVRRLAAAVRNGLRHLGMLPGRPERAEVEQARLHEVRAASAGWWVAAVRAGEEVQEGTLLGRIRDLAGPVVTDVRSPRDGVVLVLTTSPPVEAGSALCALGVPS